MIGTQRSKRSPLYGMVTAAALSLLLVGPALATDATTATVTGGSLAITNPAADDFTPMSVTGAVKVTFALVAGFSVSDLTGSGAGWHVTAQATQFDGANHDLAAGSLVMSAPTVAASGPPFGTTSPVPTVVVGPYTIDNGAVSISSAAKSTGMGKYDFSQSLLVLFLPDNVYADTYTSIVTFSAVTAP